VLLEPEFLKAAAEESQRLKLDAPIPKLCMLVTASAFDAAVHDAYGKAHGLNCYHTYDREFMSHDLAHYLTPDFKGEYLDRYISQRGRLLNRDDRFAHHVADAPAVAFDEIPRRAFVRDGAEPMRRATGQTVFDPAEEVTLSEDSHQVAIAVQNGDAAHVVVEHDLRGVPDTVSGHDRNEGPAHHIGDDHRDLSISSGSAVILLGGEGGRFDPAQAAGRSVPPICAKKASTISLWQSSVASVVTAAAAAATP